MKGKPSLPKLVVAITNAGDAWIMGSAARWFAGDDPPNDIDIVVPFEKWQVVAPMIPRDAQPNKFGGWRFTTDGVDVDVFPDNIGRLMSHTGCNDAWHPKSNNRWNRNMT